MPFWRTLCPRQLACAAALACWAAAGCHSVVDPALPSGAVAFAPPPVYAQWWAMTEACAGRSRSFGEVSWFVVPQAMSFPNGSAGEANGYYSNPGGRIVLAGRYELDATVVRHEMLHALLRGASGHPRADFLARCAGLVTCGPACVRDAGPPPVPPAGTPVVPLSTLRVSAELSPALAGVADDGAWYTLTVTATNPASTAVVLARPAYDVSFGYELAPDSPPPDLPPPPTPGQITAYTGDVPVYDEGTRQFAAGETKRQVFDIHVVARPQDVPDRGDAQGDVRIPAGRYAMRSAFGGRNVGPTSPAVAATLTR